MKQKKAGNEFPEFLSRDERNFPELSLFGGEKGSFSWILGRFHWQRTRSRHVRMLIDTRLRNRYQRAQINFAVSQVRQCAFGMCIVPRKSDICIGRLDTASILWATLELNSRILIIRGCGSGIFYDNIQLADRTLNGQMSVCHFFFEKEEQDYILERCLCIPSTRALEAH